MKLEIVFKDGRKDILDNIQTFNVIPQIDTFEVAKMPTEGKLFEINPLEIDRSRFQEVRTDKRQERARQIIQKAFVEVDKKPEKYDTVFFTLIPKKSWEGYKLVSELKEYAISLGGHMADWIEQALEWAQRIHNGESWETVCNCADTAKLYRLIIWAHADKSRWVPNDYMVLVGGSRNDNTTFSASYVNTSKITDSFKVSAVPLVSFRKE